MASVALVSVLGPDRVGLVAAIAEHLFDVGVNLRDTTFAALGSGAEFVALCELPTGLTAADIEAGLKQLPELDGAEIRSVPYAFDPSPGPAGNITHRITISGGDQLGLVARLSEVFKQYEANIVRLEARKAPGQRGRPLCDPVRHFHPRRTDGSLLGDRQQYGRISRPQLSGRKEFALTANGRDMPGHHALSARG
jgi:glycine cleavage system transcriptional repressor